MTARWERQDPTVRSFWQSPIVQSEINRRITGDPDVSPVEYFARVHCQTPRRRALSIGCGDGGVELMMLRFDACERVIGVDISQTRLDRARAATPPELAERFELVCANVEKWRPDGRFDLVIVNGAAHHLERLEAFFDLLDDVLTDDGVVYLDEFVGPSRFQWTEKQLEIINRILDRFSEDLRQDLVAPEIGSRPPVTRPAITDIIAADPSEAARSSEIRALLHQRLATVEEREWGGAVFHQLFNRIMGNFAGRDDLVRVIMEFDAILTEERVVESDYLWGVYRQRSKRSPPAELGSQLDGRVDAIDGRVLAGWAVNTSEPDLRVGIDVLIDHQLVAKTVADLPRDDLRRAGKGDGAHAFRVQLPRWSCDGRHHSISVVAPAASRTIPAARGWERHNRTEPEGTVFSVAEHSRTIELPAGRVLGGVDGWAFPCADRAGSLAQMLGDLTLSALDLDCYRNLMSRRAQVLGALDIPYIVAVAPAKAAVYPERLPVSSPPLNPPRLAEQLLERLAGTKVILVDLHSPLRVAADRGEDPYCKRDRRWSDRGAMIAAEELARAARHAGVSAAEISPEDFSWHHETISGDLAGRATVTLIDGRLEPSDPTGGEETVLTADTESLANDRSIRTGDDTHEILRRLDQPDDSSALVLTDPDIVRLQPFLSLAFARSHWLAGSHLDLELVKAERPAVVLHVLDETNLVDVPYGSDV